MVALHILHMNTLVGNDQHQGGGKNVHLLGKIPLVFNTNLMSKGRLRCLHFLGGTGVSPVQAQAKACGYQIFPSNLFVSSILYV